MTTRGLDLGVRGRDDLVRQNSIHVRVGFPTSVMEDLWEDGSYTGVSRVDALRQVCVAGSR